MIFQDWGLVHYNLALSKQLDLLNEVFNTENHPGFLVFCSHPAIVTTGRQTKAEDIFAWTGEVQEISRGGRATYHGPSQLVVYPIINLKEARNGRAPQEVRGYLRAFEQAIVATLKSYHLEAVGKTTTNENTDLSDTGVWINNKKVASMGIAVKKWITYHGAAINFFKDAAAFQGINPCGYESNIMTSLEELSREKLDLDLFKNKLRDELIKYL